MNTTTEETEYQERCRESREGFARARAGYNCDGSKKVSTEYGKYEAPEHAVLAFPLICASLGGVQMVRYSARYAWITKANGEVVRVPRSSLPTVDKWTAFNLADAVAA